MVVPDRNPRELLMAGDEIQVGSIRCDPRAVVIERKDLLVRLWDAANTISPAVVSILILVNVITKVNDVVYRVL